jgi:hypothetical protein
VYRGVYQRLMWDVKRKKELEGMSLAEQDCKEIIPFG